MKRLHQSALTIGRNIAVLEHTQYQVASTPEHTNDNGDPVFPSFWRVSVIEGDVSFVHWTEQYNFLSDNDTMRVTTTGVETTLANRRQCVARPRLIFWSRYAVRSDDRRRPCFRYQFDQPDLSTLRQRRGVDRCR